MTLTRESDTHRREPADQATERRLGRPALVAVLVAFGLGLAWASVDPFTTLVYLAYGVVGLVLVIRRPENRVSWLVLAIGFSFLLTTTWPGIDPGALERGSAPPHHLFGAWLASWSGYVTMLAFLALTIVFPSGRLPSGRWRGVTIAVLVGCAVLIALPAFASPMRVTLNGVTQVEFQNPVAVVERNAALEAAPVLVVPILAAGVLSMLARYRRSTGLDRLQLRWLVASVALVAVGLLAAFATIAIAGEGVGDFIWIPVILAYPTVPIAIAVAILRYRLYAIDRIISRTVSWAAVTGIVGGGFVLVLLALQSLLAGVTQGRTLAVALSTLGAFALLQPVRARVQALVDRRFDRARIDAQRIAEQFGERLREDVSLVAVGAELQRTVDASLRPRRVGLWVRERGRG